MLTKEITKKRKNSVLILIIIIIIITIIIFNDLQLSTESVLFTLTGVV